ncbi:MAG: hypothetical protein ACRDJT_03995 [Actinomycetota bacterium]
MLVDWALKTTLRNFSTFWLIVAAVTIPLNLAWATLFQDVIAAREIHEDIESLPSEDPVRGVDGDAIERSRYAQLIVLALELGSIPLLLRATRRAIEQDASGHVPTALGAWRAVGRSSGARSSARWQLSVALAMAGFALVVLILATLIGALLAAPMPDSVAWLVVGLTRGAALALALPFLLVGLVEARSRSEP